MEDIKSSQHREELCLAFHKIQFLHLVQITQNCTRFHEYYTNKLHILSQFKNESVWAKCEKM